MSKNTLPMFICCLDLCASQEKDWFVKAMEETNIYDAMKRIEQSIKKKPGTVYIGNLFVRKGNENIYKPLFMLRNTDSRPFNWIRRCKENNESEWGSATWIPTDENRHGYLLFEDDDIIA